jgi:hypothetical protein
MLWLPDLSLKQEKAIIMPESGIAVLKRQSFFFWNHVTQQFETCGWMTLNLFSLNQYLHWRSLFQKWSWLEWLAREKHSSLFGPFESYEENEMLWLPDLSLKQEKAIIMPESGKAVLKRQSIFYWNHVTQQFETSGWFTLNLF